ncbi:MAG: TetR/AcrR family transcriptional regulator [Actinomycetaceae bacterium]|nr:TetR/AcrR family transcriptional regulator [Actinomycetaceae bacterium]
MEPKSAKRKRSHTRTKLVSAAAQVFAAKGVAGATVDDLVQAAGFTRGAFYSNFSNKEEVFAAALSEFTEDLVDAMQLGIDERGPSNSPNDAIRAILSSIRPLGRVWVLLEAEGVRQALINEDVRRVYLESRDYLQRALLDAMTQSGYAVTEKLAQYPQPLLRTLAELLLNAYSESIIRELLEGTDSTGRLVELLIQVLGINDETA